MKEQQLELTTRKRVLINGVQHWVVQSIEPEYLNMRTALGATLRKKRTEAGMTLRDLSAHGVSLGYISEIERGTKEASTEVLGQIAKGLGVPVASILRDTADLMETPV